MGMTTDYFFVYGTLKSGFGNNRLLTTSRFVGHATSVHSSYKMSCVGFPYLFKSGHNLVRGEVYEVTDEVAKRRIDGLEGYPTHYTREVHPFLLDRGGVVDAWVYLNPNPDRYDNYRTKVIPVESVLEWKGASYA